VKAGSPSNDEISQEKAMDHGEALQMMAAERYLLDELTPEERDAFEQHMFSCHECSLDIRAGAAFINEAKVQLPGMDSPLSSKPAAGSPAKPQGRKRWSFLWQPAFVMPAFAVMLAVIAYQNFSTFPALRRAESEPKVAFTNPLHVGTRGAAHMPVQADRAGGLALALDLPSTYSAYQFDLYGAGGKRFWTHTLSAGSDTGIVLLLIPPSALRTDSFILTISGITPQNERVEVDRRVLDVQFTN
jgi:hypothetical protein